MDLFSFVSSKKALHTYINAIKKHLSLLNVLLRGKCKDEAESITLGEVNIIRLHKDRKGSRKTVECGRKMER